MNQYFTPTNIVAMMMLLVTLILVIAIGYFAAVERPYLYYGDLPVKVLKHDLHPGEVIPLKITRCNRSKVQKIFTSSRFLDNTGDDQELLMLELIAVSVAPGCNTVTTNVHRIPESTAPGNYQLTGISTVPGLIRDFQVDWYTEPFNVLPNRSGKNGGVGLRGIQGPPGEPGVQGPPGEPGVQGARGFKGKQGVAKE